mgnify:CR=1 FL=1
MLRTTELYVEIGTNAFDTWDGMLPKREGAFLVAFEPLVDKWAVTADAAVDAPGRGRAQGAQGEGGVRRDQGPLFVDRAIIMVLMLHQNCL